MEGVEFRLLDDAPAGPDEGKGGGEAELDDLRAGVKELFADGGEVRQDLRGGLGLEKLPDVTETRRGARNPDAGAERRLRHPGERTGFFLAHAGPQERGVGHRAAMEADMVDAPGVGEDPFGAHLAVGTLKADDPVVGRGPEE